LRNERPNNPESDIRRRRSAANATTDAEFRASPFAVVAIRTLPAPFRFLAHYFFV
jgi:hypothetical protein